MKRSLSLILALLLAASLAACRSAAQQTPERPVQPAQELQIGGGPVEELGGPASSEETSVPDGGFPADEPSPADDAPGGAPDAQSPELPEDGSYTTKEDVALYLHLYGHLPDNFITKKEAEALGWTGGSLEPYAPGKCIGGSRFGNYEGLLPSAKGRSYTECDIDTLGQKSRGAKRIVFSNDGLIYYTGDHYRSFELLYGEED